MVLLASTVTALQTLLELCRAYAGPHDIVYNTTKTVCKLVRPKQSQGRYSTRVGLENEELNYVEELRYIGHMITADVEMIRILKIIQEAKCSWRYAGQGVLICTYGGKNQILQIALLPNLRMCSLASFIPELN